MSSSLRRPRSAEVRSRQLWIAIPCLLGALTGAGCAGSDDSGGGGSGAGAGTSGAAGSSATGGTSAKGGELGTAGTAGLGGQPGSGGQSGVAGKSGSGVAGSGGPGVGGETGSGGTRATGAGGSSSGAAGSSSTGVGGSGQTAGEGGHGGAPTGVGGGRGGSAGTAGPAGTTGTMGGHSGTAGTNGGNAGAPGGSTGAGGTSSSTCNVAPVDPNATPQARNLLCYLYSIYGKNVLSGQQETSWSNPAGDISYYTTNVGKAPAILGGDYLYPSGTSSRALAYWNAGGLTMIRYHMGAPPNADSYDNSMLAYSSTQCNNVITAGTAENTSFLSKLDYVATEVGTLQTGKAAVILALFHETQQGGWFWWSKCSATQFVALYKYTYSYLVNTKGLHNLVRLMPYSGSPTASFFPGKDSVDISGGDTYGTNPPFGSLYTSVKGIIGSTMPAALHETGTIPQPSTMFPTTAPWLLWNVWAGYETSANTVTTIQSAYASPYTITRDEVPNLK